MLEWEGFREGRDEVATEYPEKKPEGGEVDTRGTDTAHLAPVAGMFWLNEGVTVMGKNVNYC